MGNYLLALGLVAVGILLLLANIGIISLEMNFSWENIYPVLLAGAGVKLWADHLSGRGGSWVWGSFLTVLGGLLILDRFQVLSFTLDDVFKLWPLLFIYIGFNLFFQGGKSKRRLEIHYDSEGKEDPFKKDKRKRQAAKSNKMIVGSQQYKQDNWKVEPMDLWNGIGDYQFDFTKAFIPDKDTPITVRGWIGDVKMIIPKNVPFRVEAKMRTGDIKVVNESASGLQRQLTYETEDYEQSVRRLSLYIEFSVGSIRIDQV